MSVTLERHSSEIRASDEETFYVCVVVNRYNYRISGSQNLHVTCELERGSPKVSMHDKFIEPIFFSEKTMTGRLYLDMQELYALPELTSQTRWGAATFLPLY
jgi:hypothetical protein